MRSVSMSGIQERSARFVERCNTAVGRTPDIFVRVINSPLEQWSVLTNESADGLVEAKTASDLTHVDMPMQPFTPMLAIA